MKPRWLGRLSYEEGLAAQLAARERVLAGGEDELLVLEHHAVVTLGRRGGQVDAEALEAMSTPLVSTDRGGFATWHGPGQMVAYPIVNLRRLKLGVPEFVARLGVWLVETCARLGVSECVYDACRPGVYVQDKKLGSIGLHIHKGVTTHGLSLNVSNHLDGFAAIVVCGHQGLAVTTLSEHRGQALELHQVRDIFLEVVRSSGDALAPSPCTLEP